MAASSAARCPQDLRPGEPEATSPSEPFRGWAGRMFQDICNQALDCRRSEMDASEGVDERPAVRFRIRSPSGSSQELYQLEQRVGDSPASYSQSLGGVTARSRRRATVD